jgi:putative membrane protein
MEREVASQPSTPAFAADPGTELASRRTGMAFQRTRLAADRTLMAVIRTALSLIGFGFTIYQFFEKLEAAQVVASSEASRNFGIALVALGIAMLALGIAYHVSFMIGLRNERAAMRVAALVHAESHFPVSLTLIVAVLLLAIGLVAIASMTFLSGLFS